MQKLRNRIKKMNFQQQSRKYEPLSDNDKYIIRLAGYRRQELRGRLDEDILRTTGTVSYTHLRAHETEADLV